MSFGLWQIGRLRHATAVHVATLPPSASGLPRELPAGMPSAKLDASSRKLKPRRSGTASSQLLHPSIPHTDTADTSPITFRQRQGKLWLAKHLAVDLHGCNKNEQSQPEGSNNRPKLFLSQECNQAWPAKALSSSRQKPLSVDSVILALLHLLRYCKQVSWSRSLMQCMYLHMLVG